VTGEEPEEEVTAITVLEEAHVAILEAAARATRYSGR